MSIVRVLIRSTAPPGAPARPAAAGAGRDRRALAELVQDLLWAHAAPPDEVDHIRVRPFPTGPQPTTEAAVFVRADSDAVAQERVRGLLRRTVEPLGRLGLHAEVPFH
ncbi:hypothetical protein V2S66_14790 [Streptomyces sp. V4-01]|uniref:Uncharacterized protein n=1 Tax=Actinacidiphila polyblastidii TaxID=3110430 RepID=A0ABU7PBN2_9ACTN|nr:hypothetical protein [Streptomyces sp. V4-01]